MSRSNQQLARLVQELIRLIRTGRIKIRWLVALGLAVVAYLLLQPVLERSFGVDLPGLGDLKEVASSSPSHAEGSDDGDLHRIVNAGSRDPYESPAGLRYTRGSQHGHRLKHLMAHTRDDVNRPGQHGVFDSDDPGEVVALVDEAYANALAGRKARTKREGDRTIYTVDLGRRVGYVGGESGNRRGRPAANHVRLVLENRNVITAFPVRN